MIIRSPESEVKIVVDRDPVKTSFEEWAKPGHFSRTIAKGPDTTTWIWNLHADAHDFDSHTSDLEEISRKVFSAHFGQLSIIFLWLSGMYFHGARFSNYEAWLSDPTHIGPSAQVVWPIVGQEILNGDVGGGFRGIQITSGFFQIWRVYRGKNTNDKDALFRVKRKNGLTLNVFMGSKDKKKDKKKKKKKGDFDVVGFPPTFYMGDTMIADVW